MCRCACLNDWIFFVRRKENQASLAKLELSDVKYFNLKIFHIFVVNSSEDGWWEAENADGKQGVVPKTLLKVNTTEKCFSWFVL